MDATARAREARGHDVLEAVRRRRQFSLEHLGDPPREALIAVTVDDVGEVFFFEAADQLGSGFAISAIHAHVEGRVETKREATLTLIELKRRHAKVGENGVGAIDAEVVEGCADLRKWAAHQRDLRKARSDTAGSVVGKGAFITVEADRSAGSADGVGKEAQVAAAAGGAVDDDSSCHEAKRLHARHRQHRQMATLHVVAAVAGGARGSLLCHVRDRARRGKRAPRRGRSRCASGAARRSGHGSRVRSCRRRRATRSHARAQRIRAVPSAR